MRIAARLNQELQRRGLDQTVSVRGVGRHLSRHLPPDGRAQHALLSASRGARAVDLGRDLPSLLAILTDQRVLDVQERVGHVLEVLHGAFDEITDQIAEDPTDLDPDLLDRLGRLAGRIERVERTYARLVDPRQVLDVLADVALVSLSQTVVGHFRTTFGRVSRRFEEIVPDPMVRSALDGALREEVKAMGGHLREDVQELQDQIRALVAA